MVPLETASIGVTEGLIIIGIVGSLWVLESRERRAATGPMDRLSVVLLAVLGFAVFALLVLHGLIFVGILAVHCILGLRAWNSSTRRGERLSVALLATAGFAVLFLLMLLLHAG